MSPTIEKAKPKFFTIFRVICILLGAFGLLTYSMMLMLSAVPSIKQTFESLGLTNYIILLDIIRSLMLLLSSVFIFKMKNIGWILILICAIWDAIESIFSFVQSYSSVPFLSSSNAVALSFLAVNVLIFQYFIRSDVKVYISAKG